MNTYWDTAVPIQSVHLKRIALRTVSAHSGNARFSALRADLTYRLRSLGIFDWGTQPTAGGGVVHLRKRTFTSKPGCGPGIIEHVLLYLRRGAHARAKQLEDCSYYTFAAVHTHERSS